MKRIFKQLLFPLVSFLLLFFALSVASCNDYKEESTTVNTPPKKVLKPKIAVQNDKYVKRELIIKFDEKVARPEVDVILSKHGAFILKKFAHGNTFHVGLKKGLCVKEAIKIFNGVDGVIWAEPNYIKRANGFKGKVIKKKPLKK